MRIKVNSIYQDALTSDKRYLVLKGGAGSGKSIFTVQKIIIRCLSEEKHRFLCLRKVASTLRPSVYQTFIDQIVAMGLAQYITINKTEMRITFMNGNEVLMAGMDDPEKIKSIAGITGVWCEEATEFDEKDFNQLELRVRGETASYKQFILTFNPIDEGHWIKKRFYDHHDDDVLLVNSTYRDNKFLDPEYVYHLENRTIKDENLYRIYTLGEWGKPRSGFEFYKQFNFGRDVKPLNYNPQLPIHLSFDFNVNPGMHCLVYQIDGSNIYCIDEIKTTSPNNNTKGICKEFESRGNYYSHQAGLFIYGDPAGKQQDTRSESGHNDFRIIEMALAKYRPVLRLLSKAPPVATRGQFINSIFAEQFDGLTMKIDPKCKGFIDDLTYLKEAADGTKLKEKVKDESGISYEKYGHYSDCQDYMICMAFANSFEKFQRGDVLHQYFVGDKRKGTGW